MFRCSPHVRVCGPTGHLGPGTGLWVDHGEQDSVVVIGKGFSASGMLFLLLFPGKELPARTISHPSDLAMTVGAGGIGAGPQTKACLSTLSI